MCPASEPSAMNAPELPRRAELNWPGSLGAEQCVVTGHLERRANDD